MINLMENIDIECEMLGSNAFDLTCTQKQNYLADASTTALPARIM